MFLFLNCSCQLFDYSSAEKKAANKMFLAKKQFIYQFSFCGVIKEKRNCPKCDLNKYSLSIKLDSCFTNPTFSDLQYHPYYSFENDSLLIISVSKQAFELSNTNDYVKKYSESNNIIIHDMSCVLLSNRKELWIP